MKAARAPSWLVAAGLLLLYVFLASRTTLWDRDEPRFSRATVELVRTGDWIVPRFNGDLRPDKPIMIYWLMSLPVRLLGPNALACRIPSILGVLSSALIAAHIARRRLRLRCGTGGVVLGILATSPLALMIGTAATADGVMLACITASMAVFSASLDTGFRWRHAGLLGLLLGAGLLTKGPVAIAVPLLSIVGTWLLGWRGLRPSAGSVGRLVVAVAIGAALFLAWALPANEATGGEFARRGLGHHVVQRSVTPLEGHGGRFWISLPYYLPVVVLGFFPWVLFLPGALSAICRQRLADARTRAFLLGWIVPTFLLMTLVATKLPHYVLPIWPALALLTGAFVVQCARGEAHPGDEAWVRRTAWVILPLAGLGALALMIGPWLVPVDAFAPIDRLRVPTFSLGVLLGLLSLLTWREVRSSRPGRAAWLLAVGAVLLLLQAALTLLPRLEEFKLSPTIARSVREQVSEDVEIALFDFKEPSLIFYLDRPGPVRILPDPRQVREWADGSGAGLLVISRGALDALEGEVGPLGLAEVTRVAGINIAKGRHVEVLALARGR